LSIVCLEDFEKEAKKLLPSEVYNYYRSGAQDEISLARNCSAFNDIFIAPSMFQLIEECDTHCEVFGNILKIPVMVSPMAFHGLVNLDGELATMRAVEKSGTGMVVSTMSSISLEDIALQSKTSLNWFQLYMYKSKELTELMLRRAEKSAYQAIVITVDMPVMGRRYDDMRAQFKLPADIEVPNIPENIALEMSQTVSDSSIKKFTDKYFKKSITLDDIAWMKSITSLPVLVKGILHPNDIEGLLEIGIDGVIVSNHGGRQLDTALASIDALPAIARNIKGELPILIDGGFRRGIDVLKALALGADCIFLGRPVLWGLACQGEAGVVKVLNIIRDELKDAMAMCGLNSIEAIKSRGKDLLYTKVHFQKFVSSFDKI